MSDIIVYTIVSKPGGADGLDASNEGGGVVKAVVEKHVALDIVKKDTRYEVKPIIVDPDELRKEVLSRLTPVEQLFFTYAYPRQNNLR
jgi:hypothetical protein